DLARNASGRQCVGPLTLTHILLLKKPGPYRNPTTAQQEASRISREEYARWYRPVWDDIAGAKKTAVHPAPFPVEIPYRLIRMFSFAGDTVLDPFGGIFNTSIAAMRAGRNSVCNEIAQTYFEAGLETVREKAITLALA
ncbi:MAG: site-specific DNA-methyltransferase, partial [Desulfovibrio sp.]|uniref:site-specific DNA-methyltransferase n=1 Tax=Desulfovibrio sp. TaxID=885 RepID=UPI00135D5FFC